MAGDGAGELVGRETAENGPAPGVRGRSARAFWLRQMLQWHWISAAISLIGMLAFAVTGITLNHAGAITAKPEIVARTQAMAPAAAAALASESRARAPLPSAAATWVEDAFGLRVADADAEWSRDEIYLAVPRPGGDATLTIGRATGEATVEDTDRGWVAYFNDLHKGRHAGAAWALFIDVFAAASIVFCLTGLALLWLKAVARPSTWPLVAAGLLIPAAVAVFLIH